MLEGFSDSWRHVLLAGALIAVTCRPVCAAENYAEDTRSLLHTVVTVKAYGKRASEALEAAYAEMKRVNDLLNNYDPKSEISAVNTHAGTGRVGISSETAAALKFAKHYGTVTGGAFDVTIGPLLRLWGFAAEVPGLQGAEPDSRAIEDARECVDFRAIEIVRTGDAGKTGYRAGLPRKGMWIDVGAFSKGYVADKGMAVFEKFGIHHALIAAGGTICTMGEKQDTASPWTIGIRHPRKDQTFMTVLELKNMSVSTSGDYERFYRSRGKRRTHIIDPRTGRPVSHTQSVTVLAPDGRTSDALSTALFVLGAEKGTALVDSLEGVESLIVTSSGKIVFSADWPQRTVVY